MDIDEEIRKANHGLGSNRIKVLRRGGTLWLRGTLPPKSGSKRVDAHQQKFPAGVRATMAGLRAAVAKAKEVGAHLDMGTFRWGDWVDLKEEEERKSFGDWVEEFGRDYRDKRGDGLKALRSWNASYGQSFGKLPLDAEISVATMLETIKARSQPNTKLRKRLCQNLFRLAEFAKLEGREVLLEYQGDYSVRSVQPRSLPSDEDIFEVICGIPQRDYRWWLGAIACYGFRPGEVFAIDIVDFPRIEVIDSKTGKPRTVYPVCPKEWLDEWQLEEVFLPSTYETKSTTYGQRLSGWITNHRELFPYRAYDLRHCFARRCFTKNIPVDMAARLMGHSLQVHTRVYRAWIDDAYYRTVFEGILDV